MHITLVSTGDSVPLGRSVQAVMGPYAGTWWRVDDVRKADGRHLVCASRAHRVGRHHIVVAPEVFGLVIQEIVAWYRHVVNILVSLRRKVDDGLILGALALIPLALFEAFHGGEATRELLVQWLGGGEH